jgi:hypothetical protein
VAAALQPCAARAAWPPERAWQCCQWQLASEFLNLNYLYRDVHHHGSSSESFNRIIGMAQPLSLRRQSFKLPG